MKRLLSLVLSAVLVFSLGSCASEEPANSSEAAPSSSSQQEQQPTSIPFALAAYPAYSFHPILAENRANLTLAPLLFEPLFELDDSFQPVPVLCQSYVSSGDGLTWTFTLRSGITFSDGTLLTGSLVAQALNLARQPGSRYASRLAAVSEIIGDEGNITITLARPSGNLPALLDIPIPYGDGTRPLGTGPYLLSEHGDELSLTARKDWWQGQTLPAQEIPLVAVEQSDALISAFAAGDIGLVDVDLMGTNALGYSGSYETWDYATTDLIYLGFNTVSGPCRTAQVRQALAKAVDRSSIVQVDLARHAVEATLPVHPNSPLYNQSLSQSLSFQPEDLADELSELNLPSRSLELLVNSENSAKVAAAQRIVYQLQAAGVDVVLTKLTFEDFTAALSRGDFDLYLGEVVLTADFDLTALLSSSGALNYGGWQDPQTDSFLTSLAAAQGESRKTVADALWAYFIQQVPIAPICFKNGSVLTQWGRLSGLDPVRGNVFHHLEGWIIS